MKRHAVVMGVAGALAATLFLPGASGQVLNESAKVRALDGPTFDPLGNSVSVSGAVASGLRPTVEDCGAGYPLSIAQKAYLKASNTGAGDDEFGISVAVSGDTVVVGTPLEDSNATGVNGDQRNNSATNSGAAYVFVRDAYGNWSQQAYLKASNTGAFDKFGVSVAVSGDTVVVGAWQEDSDATGVNGDQGDNSAFASGAAYVFVRDAGGNWSQQAYLKASNTDGGAPPFGSGDNFGVSVAVSGDMAVIGAWFEDSSATGVNGDQGDDSATDSGAAYVFVRDAGGNWSQQAYLKALNTGADDWFGVSVAVSGDAVVIGAPLEDSSATGVNGDQDNNGAFDSGAAYVFVRDADGNWSQQAYLKASNTQGVDQFGFSVAESGDTVVVGAWHEDSNAMGVNGDQGNNSAVQSGAAYVFVGDAGGNWSQQAYLKASNTDVQDYFGLSVAASGDTVVVGAYLEDSSAMGVNGDQFNDPTSFFDSGAAYVFVREAAGNWYQLAYLKSSNTDGLDEFALSVAVSGDTVVAGAHFEDSNATGVGGDQSNNGAFQAGAAYVFAVNDAAHALLVDASATGANSGSSWADAYNSLQDALAEAGVRNTDGDSVNDVCQIWVARGTYLPDGGYRPPGGTHALGSGYREATFQLINGVALYGGFAGNEINLSQRDIAANPTILSGDLAGDDTSMACTDDSPDCDSFGGFCVDDFCIISNNIGENSFHVVTGSGTDATAVLDGCTISGGNANGTGFFGSSGGGMFNFDATPRVTACTFRANSATLGGGGMYNFQSSPTVTNCTFSPNLVAESGEGGGMFNGDSSPTVINSSFSNNFASYGGGMLNRDSSSPTVIDCTFNGNSADVGGGGMLNAFTSSPTVIGCVFTGNSGAVGAGLRNEVDSGPAVVNCMFSGNRASNVGGGMSNFSSRPTLTNCTFRSNGATNVAGGMFNCNDSSPTITNSIFWQNSDAGGMNESAQIYDIPELCGGPSSTSIVNWSIVQGGWSGAGGGNSDADPLFLDPDGLDGVPGTEDDNLRLGCGSPCIDAGDNTAAPADILDLDNDGNTTEPVPFDLDGNPRFVDDSGTPDSGLGSPPILDRGAYEFQSASFCDPGDLECDCDVDLRDFARWVLCFDAPDPLGCNPAATPDLDGDGHVDLADHALFRANLTGPGLR